ncbi:HNH/ENDO VII family nuclease [Burkholderia pseudomallei]|uniref:HNH/ENDO VII family nuclease n=1 Tax=Burkholderia pseudomallei TaxID=28450 RepID=UPI001AAEB7F1|nr:HNH/ENDO VII family nuclease [Burkholderia pseudomallei]MBO2953162.1 hypothetical protein [Burkholderia pseudomallei]MBO3051216.1 hypothetical protein [Burkholderia pseudomallei]
MSASEREARDNLVASLVAGVAAVSGQNVATATGAGKIEVENNQVSIGRTVTGPQNVPQGMGGYFGEQRQKGDGVIADPATALDSTIKPTGSLIYPMPDAKTVGDWITELIPDQLKGLVEYVITAVNLRPGFRKQTVQDAWDKAADGSQSNTKACPTCGKDVAVPPGQGRRDWDVDHQPPWSTRDLSGMTRDQVIDEYNKGTRLECPSCNRSHGAKPAGQ